MILITINSKRRELATEWDDLTIQQAIDLVCIPLPDKITDITDPAQWLNYGVQYASQAFTLLSGFDRATVDKTQAADIIVYFNHYILKFIVDLHSQTPQTYEPTGIKSFKMQGVEYLLPTSLKVESKTLPMYSATAVEFVESSNVMALISDLKTDGIKYLPLMIAIYCRPKGDSFNEKIATERAELFKELPMSVAWELFFCIQKLTLDYSINILKFTQKQMQRQLTLLNFQVWIQSVIRHGFTKLLNRRLKGV